MRVGRSSSLSGVLGEMGPAATTSASSETAESVSFAAEVSTAVQAQEAASEARQAPPGSPGTAQAAVAPASVLESGIPIANLAVVDGLMAMPASKVDAAGVVSFSDEHSPPVQPMSASNLIFNLVTGPDSASMASECRLAVDNALREIGLDPRNYRMSYWEELVGYPGGSFMNRCITVETPLGHKMDFNADLTLRSPHVTAGGLQMLDLGLWVTASPEPAPARA